jgi:hypothetical protein
MWHFLTQQSTDTYTIGFAVQPTGIPRAGALSRTYSAGTVQNDIRVTGAGEIAIYRGSSTLLGTSSGAGLTQDIWSYIEVTINLHASTGTIDVWVNGVNVLSDTGLNTQGGSAFIDLIAVRGDTVYRPVFDDVYVLDDSGTDNTSRLGEVYVETLVPDADGNVNAWTRVGGGTNNWEAVDDMAPPDDDTTYVHSATATDQDLFGMAALTSGVGTVFAVEASALVRKEDAGFREIRLQARSNVTEAESGNISFSANEYRYINHIFENDPNGAIDWTEASVNAAEFGIVLET